VSDMRSGPVAPCISIIVPARNAAALLGATLESVLQQSFADFEIVVVDDGSTDATAEVARGFRSKDPRVQVLSGPGRGVSAARNAGLGMSRGQILLFLDADDLLLADSLLRFYTALASSRLSAALGGIKRIAEDGSPLPGNSNTELAEGGDHLTKLLRKNFVVNGGALAIRREAIDAVGGYAVDLAYGEDWEFWCRLAECGDFAIVAGEPVLAYRQMQSGANYRARGPVFALRVPCIEKIAARESLRVRYGRKLNRLLRSRRIDVFWSGVRSEFQFGSRARALMMAAAGACVFPDSLAEPALAKRFLKSLGR
jgi:glycosyltransferase involved in cell wall biosynthesis